MQAIIVFILTSSTWAPGSGGQSGRRPSGVGATRRAPIPARGAVRSRSGQIVTVFFSGRRVAMPTIRPATTDDAPALARFAEAIFRVTIGPMNNTLDIDAHCRRYYRADIQAAEIADPKWTTMLVQEGAELVGYLQLRWRGATESVVAERPGEIQRFYLD